MLETQKSITTEDGNTTTTAQYCVLPQYLIDVLYVDDEVSLLEVCKIFLEQKGEIFVTVAPSAIKALEILDNFSFDVIISDYQMPGMDGIAFLKHLQKKKDPTPFFLFTGKGREEIVIEAINNGATYYIQKGGNCEAQFAELEHKIKEAARRRRAEDALKESELRYRTLFENSGTAIMITDDDTTISLANSEFFRLTGYTEDEICGKISWKKLVFHEDLESMVSLHRGRRVHPDEVVKQYEFRMVTKMGNIRNMLVTVDVIPGTEKSVASLIDITARITAEIALKKKTEELIDAYKKLEEVEEEVVQQFGSIIKNLELEREKEAIPAAEDEQWLSQHFPSHLLHHLRPTGI
jgi:PAS domain S-box-containing protein